MVQAVQTRAFGFKPLYLQVKDSLVQRLIDGIWQPGQLIPSEFELARELGVSQGTVRKALDAMTVENLLLRRQGRGTFVAEPEDSRILFQFFRLVPDDAERRFPDTRSAQASRGKATRREAELLTLTEGDSIWRIERVRTFADEPLLSETITLPADRFPGFDEIGEIPNNVYRLYSQRWGITIGSASEQLKAVAAGAREAAALGCERGAPLLEITRVAYDLENRQTELRISRCLTDRAHYRSELR